ncbi:MAG: cytochrome c [Proteobacteria bacterium]|nr:cytochrome c [Pseudomonadota bacterium]
MKPRFNMSCREISFNGLSNIYNKKLFIVLAVFMLFAITDRQSFAADEEPITEEQLAEIRSNPEYIKNSKTLFFQNCGYCHGGEEAVGGKARKMLCETRLKPDYVYKVITNGKKGQFIMPAWKDSMDLEKRMWLTAYVMSLTVLPKCNK